MSANVTENSNFSKELSSREILKNTFVIYARNPFTLLMSESAILIMFPLVFIQESGILRDIGSSNEIFHFIFNFFTGAFYIFIYFYLISFSLLGLTRTASELSRGAKPGIAEIFCRDNFSYALRLVGRIFLILMLVRLLFMFPGFLISHYWGRLFIIALLYTAIMSFVIILLPFMILEQPGIFRAMRRLKTLAKCYSIRYYAMTFFFLFLIYYLGKLTTFFFRYSSVAVIHPEAVVSYLVAPLLMISLVLIYNNMLARCEKSEDGLDRDEKIYLSADAEYDKKG